VLVSSRGRRWRRRTLGVNGGMGDDVLRSGFAMHREGSDVGRSAHVLVV